MRTKNILWPIVLVLLGCCSNTAIWAQTKITVSIDSTQAEIGSWIQLQIQANNINKNDKLIWSPIPKELNGLEVVETGNIDTIIETDVIHYKQILQITSFDSGDYYIPSLNFQIISKNGYAQEINTDSLLVHFNTIDVDTTAAYKPIYDIMDVSMSWKDYLMWILGALLLIGLLIYLVYYFKNKKPAPPKLPVLPPETDYQRAMRLLSELQAKNYPETGKTKEFYSELSDIIRMYIEKRFSLPAMEQTTGELLQAAKRTPILKRNRTELKQILRTADLVKFAKEKPLIPEMENAMLAAITFVEKNKQKEEEEGNDE